MQINISNNIHIWVCPICGSKKKPTYNEHQIFDVLIDDDSILFISRIGSKMECYFLCPVCNNKIPSNCFRVSQSGTISTKKR